jgi:membrane-associated phospholipid phosphatase
VRVLLLALALLNPLERLDQATAREVQAARRPALEGVMRGATSVGRPPVVAAGLAAVALLDLAGGGGWGTVRLAVVTLAGTNLVVEALKRSVGRPRPDGERRPSNSSFPSSHAANAFALACVLARRWRRGLPLFLALALVVAFSRMYLNRHFLSDVVAGALIGATWAWVASRWLPLRRPAVATPAVPAGP